MTSAPRIAVVGAGIIGASIAYHLARRGAQVSLFERGRPALEATNKSFGWINASFGNPKPYFQLRQQAMQDYRRLEADIDGRLRVNWSGCLKWDLSEAELEQFVREHGSWGYDVHLVERDEIARLEPSLVDPPICAAYAPGEGTIEPTSATQALLTAAEQTGVRINLGSPVKELVVRHQRLAGLRTASTKVEADVVVVAAGIASRALCAQVGTDLPLSEKTPGLLLHCKPAKRLFTRVIEGPGLHMKQEGDGRIVAGRHFGGGPAPSDPESDGERLLAMIKTRLRDAHDLEPERVTVGHRPVPADGMPAIGFMPGLEGLYVAVMHSGVTLAPAVGRFAAEEILDDAHVDLLEPFRPGRFAAAL